VARAKIRGGREEALLSSRGDVYGGAESAREWFGWANQPKRLVLVPGGEHGTDLLRRDSPQREHLERLIVDFVKKADRSTTSS
jgi:hypothetical protein